MILKNINIILADDDKDDCLLFKEVLEELPLQTILTAVHDGDQLMDVLKKRSAGFYDVLFLDLNMPRKNGFACLKEIKRNRILRQLPVIIFSTSYDERIAGILYEDGAMQYICKPSYFAELKTVIQQALTLVIEKSSSQPHKKTSIL